MNRYVVVIAEGGRVGVTGWTPDGGVRMDEEGEAVVLPVWCMEFPDAMAALAYAKLNFPNADYRVAKLEVLP